ncbi:hypothetical protein D3C84_903020 [compost metagenome]
MVGLFKNRKVDIYAKQVFCVTVLVMKHTGYRADFLPIPVDFLVRPNACFTSEFAELLVQR